MLIGAAGAAAAGGAVVVAKGRGQEPRRYSGAFNGEYIATSVCTGGRVTVTCTSTFALAGTATGKTEESNGSVTGQIRVTGDADADAGHQRRRTMQRPRQPATGRGLRLQRPAGALTCQSQYSAPFGDGTMTNMFEFSGALSGGAITGTVRLTESGQGNQSGSSCTTTGSGGFSVNLR